MSVAELFKRTAPESVLIAPSLLSANFTHLGESVNLMKEAGADFLHIDVMDGHFVPNLTFGPPIIKALKEASDIPLDVHLMITNAEASIDWYLDAGADLITVHAEAVTHLHRLLTYIKSRGCAAAVSLNPATPVSSIREVLGVADMVLLMSVNPGFGGQSFIERTITRIAELKMMCEADGVSPVIQIDGGINVETVARCTAAGARCFVAGNAIFGASDPVVALHDIRSSAERATGGIYS